MSIHSLASSVFFHSFIGLSLVSSHAHLCVTLFIHSTPMCVLSSTRPSFHCPFGHPAPHTVTRDFFLHPFFPRFIHLLTPDGVHSFISSFMHVFHDSLVHSFIPQFMCFLINSFIHTSFDKIHYFITVLYVLDVPATAIPPAYSWHLSTKGPVIIIIIVKCKTHTEESIHIVNLQLKELPVIEHTIGMSTHPRICLCSSLSLSCHLNFGSRVSRT